MNHNHHQSNEAQKPQQVYTCPMHPEVEEDGPGLCPKCGMKLVPAKARGKKDSHKEHDKHAGHRVEMFAKKFWICLVLTIPVVAYSDIVKKIFGVSLPVFPGSNYAPFILGSVVFFYGGWVFIMGAYRELRAKLPGMMTLISLAISAAYVYSVYAVFFNPEHTLFWELTTLITIMLLGHWLEMRAVQGAQGALKELAKLLPDTAEVVRGNTTKIIPLAELQVEDIMIVKPGGKIPADGIIISGKSEINEAMVSGESKPVNKKEGDEVIAGTINGDGGLRVQVNKIGENTFLAGVMRLVAQAQASKSRLQMLSDRAALYLTIVAIATGTITFIVWLLSQAGIATATERLVAVLVIACPHALGLAVPLVASISTTMAARNGLLVKQRLALEAARTINVVLFDKTGTLTLGEFGVADIISQNGKADEVLRYAASVNSHSEHPIAKAIVAEAKKRKLFLVEPKDFQRLAGKGARGFIESKEAIVGSEILLQEAGIKLAQNTAVKVNQLEKQGKTVVHVIVNKMYAGSIALADIIREESRQAIATLKEMGLKIAMITGDSEDVAAWVSKELGIDEYFSRVLPEQKADKVKILQQKGLRVAMVGDGVNDAPALTQAEVGIAIGAGTNVAIESAGIILVKNDPRDIPKIIRLSRLTYTKMIQNLFWATGYNIIALPLAAGVLAFKGIILEPALAAAFMSLSTVIVAINASLLRRRKLSNN